MDYLDRVEADVFGTTHLFVPPQRTPRDEPTGLSVPKYAKPRMTEQSQEIETQRVLIRMDDMRADELYTIHTDRPFRSFVIEESCLEPQPAFLDKDKDRVVVREGCPAMDECAVRLVTNDFSVECPLGPRFISVQSFLLTQDNLLCVWVDPGLVCWIQSFRDETFHLYDLNLLSIGSRILDTLELSVVGIDQRPDAYALAQSINHEEGQVVVFRLLGPSRSKNGEEPEDVLFSKFYKCFDFESESVIPPVAQAMYRGTTGPFRRGCRYAAVGTLCCNPPFSVRQKIVWLRNSLCPNLDLVYSDESKNGNKVVPDKAEWILDDRERRHVHTADVYLIGEPLQRLFQTHVIRLKEHDEHPHIWTAEFTHLTSHNSYLLEKSVSMSPLNFLLPELNEARAREAIEWRMTAEVNKQLVLLSVAPKLEYEPPASDFSFEFETVHGVIEKRTMTVDQCRYGFFQFLQAILGPEFALFMNCGRLEIQNIDGIPWRPIWSVFWESIGFSMDPYSEDGLGQYSPYGFLRAIQVATRPLGLSPPCNNVYSLTYKQDELTCRGSSAVFPIWMVGQLDGLITIQTFANLEPGDSFIFTPSFFENSAGQHLILSKLSPDTFLTSARYYSEQQATALFAQTVGTMGNEVFSDGRFRSGHYGIAVQPRPFTIHCTSSMASRILGLGHKEPRVVSQLSSFQFRSPWRLSCPSNSYVELHMSPMPSNLHDHLVESTLYIDNKKETQERFILPIGCKRFTDTQLKRQSRTTHRQLQLTSKCAIRTGHLFVLLF